MTAIGRLARELDFRGLRTVAFTWTVIAAMNRQAVYWTLSNRYTEAVPVRPENRRPHAEALIQSQAGAVLAFADRQQ